MTEEPEHTVDFSVAGRPVTRPARADGAHRTPVRTCVGCRVKGERSDLMRVVMVEGVLVPDPQARIAGRGAWVHPDPHCLDLAVRRRAFSRALRLDAAPDVAAVRAEIDRTA